jgi:hypothetical protein
LQEAALTAAAESVVAISAASSVHLDCKEVGRRENRGWEISDSPFIAAVRTMKVGEEVAPGISRPSALSHQPASC